MYWLIFEIHDLNGALILFVSPAKRSIVAFTTIYASHKSDLGIEVFKPYVSVDRLLTAW